MKHFKLFLLSLAVLGISISGVNAQDIYGNYTGTVNATSSLLGLDETLDEVTVELATDGSENFLRFEEIDFGAGPIAPELDGVMITPNGSGYSISRPGSIEIIIPEITIPPYPPLFPDGETFTNVPVTITLESGSIANNVMILNVKIVATVQVTMPPLPPIPLAIPVDVNFEGILPIQEYEYDPVAVARINAMIDNNGLNATKDQPETWEFAGWSYENPIQLLDLDVYDEGLFGSINLDGLVRLESLDCMSNNLTGIILTGCTHLEEIYCHDNRLSAIDLSGLDALTYFGGEGQLIELTLDNDGNDNYTCVIQLNNPTFSESTISYEAGILKSTDPTVALTPFTVETGNSEFQLSGGMFFTYTGVGIVEALHATPLQVYPNPTTGKLTINNEQLTIEYIKVFDVYGRNMLSHTKYHPPHTVIDISSLPAGVYFLRVDTEEGSIMQKVIKQ